MNRVYRSLYVEAAVFELCKQGKLNIELEPVDKDIRGEKTSVTDTVSLENLLNEATGTEQDVLNKQNAGGDTPLTTAVLNHQLGKDDVIKLLIEKKADADRENRKEKTPLTIARECQNKDLEKLLRNLGAQKETVVDEIERIETMAYWESMFCLKDDSTVKFMFFLFLLGAGVGCFW